MSSHFVLALLSVLLVACVNGFVFPARLAAHGKLVRTYMCTDKQPEYVPPPIGWVGEWQQPTSPDASSSTGGFLGGDGEEKKEGSEILNTIFNSATQVLTYGLYGYVAYLFADSIRIIAFPGSDPLPVLPGSVAGM